MGGGTGIGGVGIRVGLEEMRTQVRVDQNRMDRNKADTLRKLFQEQFPELGMPNSRAAVLVNYLENGQKRVEIGIPYEIDDTFLEIGPYYKSEFLPMPNKYHSRKMRICLHSIEDFRRIELR